MSNRFLKSFLAFSSVIILVSSSSFAVSKTSRLTNFVDFYVGSSSPTGVRDGLPDYEFLINNRSVEVNSEDIYDNTFHVGISYGQLRAKHFLWSVGFRYTKLNLENSILIFEYQGPLDTIPPVQGDTSVGFIDDPSYNQFDINLDLNFFLLDQTKSSFSPYGGLGICAGIVAISSDISETDYSANLGMSVNFGADIKVWKSADTRTFVTLSSVNSYDFYGSSDRPKYLNIGGAIKYYFSP